MRRIAIAVAVFCLAVCSAHAERVVLSEELESAMEVAAWGDFYVQWRGLSESAVNWIPTNNWPSRSVVVNITMGSMTNLTLGIPGGFEPEKDCMVTFRVLRGGSSGSLGVCIGTNEVFSPITSGTGRYVFAFRWLAKSKTWVMWRWTLAYQNAVFNSSGENKETTGIPQDTRFAPVIYASEPDESAKMAVPIFSDSEEDLLKTDDDVEEEVEPEVELKK